MKGVPIGIQDFKKVREKDYYFVDKTRLISDILERDYEAFLFTRPRRFGKSLNMSMLDAYLNMAYEGNTWFEGLEISELRPNDPEKNSSPVVYLDLKGLGDGTYELFLYILREKMTDLYTDVLGLTYKDRKEALDSLFPSIETYEGLACLISSLKNLVNMVHVVSGKKVIVLVDEYDNAVNNASDDICDWNGSNGRTHRRLILDFLKQFIGNTLKGNVDLRFAVLTGVMKIGKESIFSGLNNLFVDSVLDPDIDYAFGFTETEISRICDSFSRPEKCLEIKEWYDGYRFGNRDVYNPWSVLNYVARGFVPGTYWAGTSGNDIIDRLLDNIDSDIYRTFSQLARSESIESYIREDIAYSDLTTEDNALLSVMVMSGYLTGRRTETPGYYEISIPNKEMFLVFGNAFAGRIGKTGGKVRSLSSAIINSDANAVTGSLSGFVMSIDPKVMSHEHAYEILCIALLMHLEGPYEVLNEIHAGKGYCDILLRSNRRNLPHAVIELKRKRADNENIDTLSDEGLRQIRDRAYANNLKGSVHLYGIAFDGADVSVKHEFLTI